MIKERILILDKERISHKLRRMAFEIWEHNCDKSEITILGIEPGGGRILADKLANIIKEISPLKVETLSISINKDYPLNHSLEFEDNLENKTLILVDDVINSGRTIIYSLNAILSFNLSKLMLAVLVDRQHKSFPISPDITGLTIATTLQDHIAVDTEGTEIIGVYLE